MTETQSTILEESHEGRVAHLILNSPHNLNAMDLTMAQAFRTVRNSVLESGREYRAILIRARGRAFSAGGDLEMLRQKATRSVEQNEREMMEFYLSFLGLRDLNTPLVCQLHGHVVGAGFCFAAACDMRFGAGNTLLAAPFTRLALHPGMGGSYFLPRAFGSEVARELMLTGRRMAAEEALGRGFLASVVESEQLETERERLLGQLLKSAPMATRALIAGQREREHAEVMEALKAEAREQALCYARPEFVAGIEALQAKQPPPWG